MPKGFFICHSCPELERGCVLTMDDYSAFPDRCMYSNGAYKSNWKRLTVESTSKPDGYLDGPPAKDKG